MARRRAGFEVAFVAESRSNEVEGVVVCGGAGLLFLPAYQTVLAVKAIAHGSHALASFGRLQP